MKPIEPSKKTTLFLNNHLLPAGFLTARAVIRHLINGKIKGIDASGNSYGWDSSSPGSPSWSDCSIILHDEHPCLRGGLKSYPIPTIGILQNSFGLKKKKNVTISLRKLYSHYRGECQYCLCKIPFSEATEDHWYPRDKGGSNHDFNLVLACRRCNTKKSNRFPYLNVEGKEVKPRPIISHTLSIPHDVEIRDEWKPYIFSLV